MNLEKKQKFQISMSIVILILVFAVTWQIKGVRKNKAVESQISNRVEVLQQDYKAELDKNEKLLQQIIELQSDLTKYREQVTESGGAAKILKEELNRAETIAGLTDVTGSGIIVTIKDGSSQNVGNIVYDNGYGIVHDTYLLTILNELRAAGAEALSLNDERILATSEIRCAGPTVSINNTKQAAPFEIKVIGNPDTLENALRMPGGAIDEAGFYGIDVTIKKSNKLLIKKYTGASTFKYAQPVEPEVTE
ncbi:MAG: DUF881 domain-containing protein [Clostridia bacterium]|nr:DUF881 domain-containing protein [Clostridia bacterium]